MRCDGLVAEVRDWAAGLEEVHARIAGRFARAEPRARVLAYLRGLLDQLERKNGWTLAEAAGEVSPDGMQRLLRTADWNADAVRDELRDYVAERLGPGGVLIVDETGFLKKGTRSAGVGRQYTGTTGKIDNCQIGVFLAYATAAGRALIDRELHLPRAWTEDRERARAAGIGEEVGFATKPELARRMLTRALDAGVPAGWLTADEIYGQDNRLRVWCERHGLSYVLATRSNDTVATVDWRQRRVRALIAEVGESAWQRRSAGAGAHGPRLYDWARVELLAGFDPGWARWLLARRSIPQTPEETPELPYYACAGPAESTLEQLIAVAGGRWRIENASRRPRTRPGWPPTRCGTTPPGIGTSPWRCSPTPICRPPAPPRKRGLRSRNRPAHRPDGTRAAAPAQHPHPHSATRPRRHRRLVLVAPATPGSGPRRPLPHPRTGTAITAVAVLLQRHIAEGSA